MPRGGPRRRKSQVPMEKTALPVIDAQQEYFAPIGKVVLPDGPPRGRADRGSPGPGPSESVPVIHIVHESRRPIVYVFAGRGSPAPRSIPPRTRRPASRS